MKQERLPIILGKGYHKGICAFKSNGGVNVLICDINGEHESGMEFPIDDVQSIRAVLHFCDKETVERVANLFQKIIDNWE